METHAFRVATLALVALALTSCKSKDAEREGLVRCQGFSLALVNMGPRSPLQDAAEAALRQRGITAADTMQMGTAAMQYSSKMDPALVARLSQEGAAAANEFIRKNDGNGIADYLNDCVKSFKDLGS